MSQGEYPRTLYGTSRGIPCERLQFGVSDGQPRPDRVLPKEVGTHNCCARGREQPPVQSLCSEDHEQDALRAQCWPSATISLSCFSSETTRNLLADVAVDGLLAPRDGSQSSDEGRGPWLRLWLQAPSSRGSLLFIVYTFVPVPAPAPAPAPAAGTEACTQNAACAGTMRATRK